MDEATAGGRLLEALERIAAAQERAAEALERIATAPTGRLPASRGRQKRRSPVRVPAGNVDDLARAKAKKALRRAGLSEG